MALLTAEPVDGGVGGQAVEPCGEAAGTAELRKCPPCGEKRLLGHVVCRRFAAHPQGQTVYLCLIGFHQQAESFAIALLGAAQDVLFIVHRRSLLTPAATRYSSSSVVRRTICSL